MNMETSRRNFLRGFAGLAAVAVAGPTLKLLPESDRERLVAQMRTGLVQDQTFLLADARPIELVGFDDLTLRNCRFIWPRPMFTPLLHIGADNGTINILDCHFDASGSGHLRLLEGRYGASAAPALAI